MAQAHVEGDAAPERVALPAVRVVAAHPAGRVAHVERPLVEQRGQPRDQRQGADGEQQPAEPGVVGVRQQRGVVGLGQARLRQPPLLPPQRHRNVAALVARARHLARRGVEARESAAVAALAPGAVAVRVDAGRAARRVPLQRHLAPHAAARLELAVRTDVRAGARALAVAAVAAKALGVIGAQAAARRGQQRAETHGHRHVDGAERRGGGVGVGDEGTDGGGGGGDEGGGGRGIVSHQRDARDAGGEVDRPPADLRRRAVGVLALGGEHRGRQRGAQLQRRRTKLLREPRIVVVDGGDGAFVESPAVRRHGVVGDDGSSAVDVAGVQHRRYRRTAAATDAADANAAADVDRGDLGRQTEAREPHLPNVASRHGIFAQRTQVHADGLAAQRRLGPHRAPRQSRQPARAVVDRVARRQRADERAAQHLQDLLARRRVAAARLRLDRLPRPRRHPFILRLHPRLDLQLRERRRRECRTVERGGRCHLDRRLQQLRRRTEQRDRHTATQLRWRRGGQRRRRRWQLPSATAIASGRTAILP